jgi:tRNA threonylcarbamoyladenosine biosynthesis protein TsaE
MIEEELSLSALRDWVPQFTSQFSQRQLILLTGDLGAGKTALTREILHSFGCDEVFSPTYGLIHEYSVTGLDHCYHVDLYRLQDRDDLESSGFWDLFTLDSGLILVEWANKIAPDLYPLTWSRWTVEIEPGRTEGQRLYRLQKS